MRDEAPSWAREAEGSTWTPASWSPTTWSSPSCWSASESDEARDGFLLDGFPRNRQQGEAWTALIDRVGRRLTAALLIEVPDDEVVRRLSGRRVSVKSGRVYHVEFDPPKHQGRCDVDGSRLVQRDDDKPETVRHRLEVYHANTKPLIDYYERQGSPAALRRRSARPPRCTTTSGRRWPRCASRTSSRRWPPSSARYF